MPASLYDTLTVDEREQLFTALLDFYQKLDQTLAAKDKMDTSFSLVVEAIDMSDPNVNTELGYCDARPHARFIAIGLHNIAKLCEDMDNFYKSVEGVNFHELAHYLFSIHNRTAETAAEGLGKTLNILNDIRDEWIFVCHFPAYSDDFQHIAVNFVLKGYDDEVMQNPANFVLCWGRRLYLPDEAVLRFEESFEKILGKDICDKVKNIVDDFIHCKSVEESIELARKLQALIPIGEIILPKDVIPPELKKYFEPIVLQYEKEGKLPPGSYAKIQGDLVDGGTEETEETETEETKESDKEDKDEDEEPEEIEEDLEGEP